jgi:hypothetical protein
MYLLDPHEDEARRVSEDSDLALAHRHCVGREIQGARIVDLLKGTGVTGVGNMVC